MLSKRLQVALRRRARGDPADLRQTDPGTGVARARIEPLTTVFRESLAVASTVLWLTVKRTVNRLPLLATVLAGLVMTVALVASVPLYAEGASGAILQKHLAAVGYDRAFLLVNWSGHHRLPFGVESYRAADQAIRERVVPLVGLPTRGFLRSGRTRLLDARRQAPDDPMPMPRVALAFREGLSKHVRLDEGTFGAPSAAGGDVGEAEATVDADLADEHGLYVGDRYVVNVGTGDEPRLVSLRLVATWVPRDADDPYWISAPSREGSPRQPTLYVDETWFLENVLPTLPTAGLELLWRVDLESRAVEPGNAAQVLRSLGAARARLAVDFPEAKPSVTIEDALRAYVARARYLELLLLVLAVPIVAILLYYTATAAAMVVEQEAGEIALLKGRGASNLQVLGVHAVEGLLIGTVATLLGPPLAAPLAQAIGRTHSFLLFAVNKPALSAQLSPQAFGWAALASALVVIAILVPTAIAVRRSIVVQRLGLGRPPERRRWTLPYELMPLAVFLYAYANLKQRQTFLLLGSGDQLVPDPLLVVMPATFILGLALISRRALPLGVRAMVWMAGRSAGPSISLALRQLARAPGQQYHLALLLMLTLPLGVFGASTARTIDHNYDERVSYQVGSDVLVVEEPYYDREAGLWRLHEFDDHRELDGVAAVARVVRFPARLPFRTRAQETTLVGVDPADFARTAFFRRDFADQSLGALMNRLLAAEHGAIVSRRVAAESQLQLGDEIPVRIEDKQITFVVAGVARFFPTVYPEDEALVVGNLSYIYGQVNPQPYEVWIRTAPGASGASIMAEIQDLGLRVAEMADARSLQARARLDPTRVSLLGMLSLGFLVAVALTVGGFAYYAFLSFRERMPQFGLLRAMGLTTGQLLTLLVFEQTLLIAVGLILGTGIGMLASWIFVPFLQLGEGRDAGVPPFTIIVPWADVARVYVAVGAMLLVAVPPTIWAISRLRLHEAIKLGDN